MKSKDTIQSWDEIDDSVKDKMIFTGYVPTYNDIWRELCMFIGNPSLSIYISLLSHRNKKYNFSFPSIDTIAIETNLSKNTVCKYIELMEEKGYLKIINAFSTNTKRYLNNRYYFPRESFYNEEEYQKDLKGEK